MQLLEREAHLAELARLLEDAAARGRIVCVGGEAGVGKTSLVRRFVDESGARVLWGSCDPLSTPSALGPVVEIAERAGGALAATLERGAPRTDVFAAALDELSAHRPTIAVLEDLHWADDATLDFLRYLARRIGRTRALVVGTYRDDEVGVQHPLRIALGDVATAGTVSRLRLEPLSPDAVRELADGTGVEAAELYRVTGGNPFYVGEVLAAGAVGVPETLRDAVVARIARVAPAARDVLDAAAVLGRPSELTLVAAVAEVEPAAVRECVERGLLVARDGLLAFRHEIARLAVEDALAADRREELHRHALAALGAEADAARLAHHAEAARDRRAAHRHALTAASRAASLRAHREAAAQYRRALRHAEDATADELVGLHERHAFEAYMASELAEALDARRRAIDAARRLGDRLREGDSMRWLSRQLWFECRGRDADAAARRAIELLEPLGPGPELALAYSNLSQLRMNAGDLAGTLEAGGRAIELAEALGDRAVLAHALGNVGGAELDAGSAERGLEQLGRAIELAEAEGLQEEYARAHINVARLSIGARRYDLADEYLRRGLAYCLEHDLEPGRLYLLAWQARAALDRGRWDEATELAATVVEHPLAPPVTRHTALVVLGVLRTRRGDPDAVDVLEEADAIARSADELNRIAPTAVARAEAAWSEGDAATVLVATEEAAALARRLRHAPSDSELCFWRGRAGARVEPLDPGLPFSVHARGEPARAAAAWAVLGCPYEEAEALTDVGDPPSLRHALAIFERLGAGPAAARTARRLRELGERGIPRGPRPATRANPRGLTPRQLEVLTLVARGLRNAEIAERLVISEKTVSHHVSAILAKLDVRSRVEASRAAAELGGDGGDALHG